MTNKDMLDDLYRSIDPQIVLDKVGLQYSGRPEWGVVKTTAEGMI